MTSDLDFKFSSVLLADQWWWTAESKNEISSLTGAPRGPAGPMSPGLPGEPCKRQRKELTILLATIADIDPSQWAGIQESRSRTCSSTVDTDIIYVFSCLWSGDTIYEGGNKSERTEWSHSPLFLELREGQINLGFREGPEKHADTAAFNNPALHNQITSDKHCGMLFIL